MSADFKNRKITFCDFPEIVEGLDVKRNTAESEYAKKLAALPSVVGLGGLQGWTSASRIKSKRGPKGTYISKKSKTIQKGIHRSLKRSPFYVTTKDLDLQVVVMQKMTLSEPRFDLGNSRLMRPLAKKNDENFRALPAFLLKTREMQDWEFPPGHGNPVPDYIQKYETVDDHGSRWAMHSGKCRQTSKQLRGSPIYAKPRTNSKRRNEKLVQYMPFKTADFQTAEVERPAEAMKIELPRRKSSLLLSKLMLDKIAKIKEEKANAEATHVQAKKARIRELWLRAFRRCKFISNIETFSARRTMLLRFLLQVEGALRDAVSGRVTRRRKSAYTVVDLDSDVPSEAGAALRRTSSCTEQRRVRFSDEIVQIAYQGTKVLCHVSAVENDEQSFDLHLRFVKLKKDIIIFPSDPALYSTKYCSKDAKQAVASQMVRDVLGCETKTSEAFLDSVPLLQALPEETKRALASLLIAKHFGPGEWVFFRGDPADGMFFVKRGEVVVVGQNGNIRHLLTGQCFGEVALLKGGFRTAGVKCAEKLGDYDDSVELLWLSTGAVRKLLKEQPELEAAWRLRLQHYTLIQERHDSKESGTNQRRLLRKKTAHGAEKLNAAWLGPTTHAEDHGVSSHLKAMVRRDSFVRECTQQALKFNRKANRETAKQEGRELPPAAGHDHACDDAPSPDRFTGLDAALGIGM
jgi:CRP-like cAMP-binding protein